MSGGTPIGADIGERHILVATASGEDESMLVSGGEAKFVRRKYRSLRASLSEAGALRARNRVGDKEQRRIKDLNHNLSRRLITFAEQFENTVIRMEDLEEIRENSSRSGVHSWHFHQLQQFITYKAERAGIRSRRSMRPIPVSSVRRVVRWAIVMATTFRVQSVVGDAIPT